MIISHKDSLFSFEITKAGIQVLIIENKELFEKIIVALYNEASLNGSSFNCISDDKVIEFRKNIEYISTAPFLNFESRDINKRLFEDLSERVNELDLENEIREALGRLSSVLDMLGRDEYTLEYAVDDDIKTILKWFNVKAMQTEGNFYERLTDYINICRYLFKKQVYIISNCKGFLSINQLAELEKYAKIYNISIVIIENDIIGLETIENKLIIDSDLCTI